MKWWLELVIGEIEIVEAVVVRVDHSQIDATKDGQTDIKSLYTTSRQN